jgi:hypothetical protein
MNTISLKTSMKEAKTLPALLIGLSLIIAAAIFGSLYYTTHTKLTTNNLLSVTGSAKTHVTSDKAKLVVSISHTVFQSSLPSGYENVAHDLKLINQLIDDSKIKDKTITESPVFMNQAYYPDYMAENQYNLIQTFTIQSDDVDGITQLSQSIPSLADQGALVSVQSLEYFYSKLPELRVSLLSDAVKDAQARADNIASATGMKVGNVQSAAAGVVQVLAPDSIDVYDYGAYDTSTIEKDVMVTVKATFRLE